MRRSTAADIIPAVTQAAGVNFIPLGPFENTKHPDCAEGCFVHRGPSERSRHVQFYSLGKCPDTVLPLRWRRTIKIQELISKHGLIPGPL